MKFLCFYFYFGPVELVQFPEHDNHQVIIHIRLRNDFVELLDKITQKNRPGKNCQIPNAGKGNGKGKGPYNNKGNYWAMQKELAELREVGAATAAATDAGSNIPESRCSEN